MVDLQSLVWVLLLVYAIECVVFLRQTTALFRRGLLLRWQLRLPGGVLGNARGALTWVHPLPLFPTAVTLTLPPVSLSEAGFLTWTPLSLHPSSRTAQNAQWFRWNDLQHIESKGSRVHINRAAPLQTASSHEAIRMAQLLRSLVKATPAARAGLIEAFIETVFDSVECERRWKQAQEAQRWLHLQSELLFFTVFLVSPVLIVKWGLVKVGWWLLGTIYSQSLLMAWVVARIHKRLYPDNGDDRFARVLSTFLAPLSAIRAPDFLSRPLMEPFHPLLAVSVLGDKNTLHQLAGQVIRDVHFPILPSLPEGLSEEARAGEQWWREHWTRATHQAVRKEGLKIEEALAAPTRTESVHRAYCPRCQTQFTEVIARCGDCGNRAAVPFPVATSPTGCQG